MLLENRFSVRRFVREDLESVIQINQLCLPENYNSFFFLDVYHNCPEAFTVAEANEKIIGYVMCRIEHGFSDLRRFKLTKKGHVVSIAVISEYRRMGVASSLMKEAIKGLAVYNANECFLEVRTSNESAIALYKKLGFDIVRTISHYYQDGADAYVMARHLNDFGP